MKFKYLYRILFYIVLQNASLNAHPNVHGLDFETAWRRVLNASPDLHIADEETAIWQAEKRQALLFPNPVLVVEMDCDMTYSLSQLIEPANKRIYRHRVAAQGESIAARNQEQICQELKEDLALVFIDVAVMQERIKIAKEREGLSQKVLEGSKNKVEIGKKDGLHHYKAKISAQASHLASIKIQSTFEKMKKNLSMRWGCSEADFDYVIYSLFTITAPQPIHVLECALRNNARYRKDTEAVYLALENVNLQRAERIPDLEVTAGYSCHDGFVVDFAVPLPIFNQNQENIRKASHRLSQTQWIQAKTYQELVARFHEIYQHFTTAYRHLKDIETELLPEAEHALEMVVEGYQKGKFDFSDLFEIQNTVFGLREEYLNFLKDYHDSKVKLEALVGNYP